MCTLAHYLEAAGIATVVVSVIRLHTVKIRPPRALFVPFELGRPMGDPFDVVGQRDVLTRAFTLLDRNGPDPVLEDFPDPVVGADDPLGQLFSVPEGANLVQEFAVMRSAYDQFVADHGSTSFGVSDMSPNEVITAVNGVLDGAAGGKRIPSKQFRFMIDDLKSLYFEAACQGRDTLTSKQLGTWFWRSTVAAKAIAEIRAQFMASDDKGRRMIADFMVPGLWVDKLGLEA